MSEEKKIGQLLKLDKELSLQEVLDSYSEIELTDDEMIEAMIWAKRRKQDKIRLAEFHKFQEENRKLKASRWNFDIIKTFMVKRALKIFGLDEFDNPRFRLDEHNEPVFDLLAYYFIGDDVNFNTEAAKWNVKNPSIKKGLLICGVYGCGKTWLMKLFSRNNRQCFDIFRAKEIAEEFLTSKEKKIPDIYLRPIDVRGDATGKPVDKMYSSDDVFNQRFLGMCIDDLGSEAVQNNFGNKMNVIGDIIEARYAAGFTGLFLHGTTNLTAEKIKEFYGGRVASRLREIFNFIELPGADRRK